MSNLQFLFSRYDIWGETINTLYMTIVPVLIAYIIGIPLGIGCVITDNSGIRANKIINRIINIIIDIGRSIPFIILIAILAESGFTRFIIGTSLGPNGMIIPLAVSCFPFVARMVEQSIKEIDQGVVDAAICMGSTDFQIIKKVYLVEAVPSLVRGLAITTITLIGYTAMAGVVGGRGLGYLAVSQGFQRNQPELMWVCVIIIMIIVGISQFLLEFISNKIDKRQK